MSERSPNSVTRREFLKIAGLAGAAVGAADVLGSLLAACGEEEATSTTAVNFSTTATTSGPTTSVSKGPEAGDGIKLGFVTPLTGPLASFGVPDKYCVDRWKE